MQKQRPDSAYLETVFFEDRDTEVRGLERRMVVTKTAHRCAYADVIGTPHEIPAGARVLNERAFVEGQWGSWWACLPCLDTWLDEIERRA